jgi:hypothetical protein
MRLKNNDKVSSVAIILPEEIKIEDKKVNQPQPKVENGTISNPKKHNVPVTTSKPVRINYYEKNKMDAPKPRSTGGTESRHKVVGRDNQNNTGKEKYHIKSYKNKTETGKDNPEDQSKDFPQNPPIPKDPVNYWGGSKYK